MGILKVARLGHPAIRAGALPVPDGWWKSPAARQFLLDMVDTMREYGGVGLAAPQVHQPVRVAVIEIEHNPRYPQAPPFPLTVLINPRIVWRSDETEENWEGCLSVPDLRGRVARASSVRIEAVDENGRTRACEASGFAARAFQHELDHLDGKVFLDRMDTPSSLTHLDEYYRFHCRDGGESES